MQTAGTVCVYSVKSDKSGLKQNMDGIDGDELDAQELLDKMAIRVTALFIWLP